LGLVGGFNSRRNLYWDQRTKLMIHLIWDNESQLHGIVCMCVVDMMTSASLKTERNIPGCANGDDRSSDQIYVYVH
jgi:hypothetical protein